MVVRGGETALEQEREQRTGEDVDDLGAGISVLVLFLHGDPGERLRGVAGYLPGAG